MNKLINFKPNELIYSKFIDLLKIGDIDFIKKNIKYEDSWWTKYNILAVKEAIASKNKKIIELIPLKIRETYNDQIVELLAESNITGLFFESKCNNNFTYTKIYFNKNTSELIKNFCYNQNKIETDLFNKYFDEEELEVKKEHLNKIDIIANNLSNKYLKILLNKNYSRRNPLSKFIVKLIQQDNVEILDNYMKNNSTLRHVMTCIVNNQSHKCWEYIKDKFDEGCSHFPNGIDIMLYTPSYGSIKFLTKKIYISLKVSEDILEYVDEKTEDLLYEYQEKLQSNEFINKLKKLNKEQFENYIYTLYDVADIDESTGIYDSLTKLFGKEYFGYRYGEFYFMEG